jgi:enoyl-[acyl-carrier protein] reductase I
MEAKESGEFKGYTPIGPGRLLESKKGLVLGIANNDSIAYGCARMFSKLGADVAVTYLNEKTEKYVRPLAEKMGCSIIMQCDVMNPGELEAVYEEIGSTWGKLDFVLHSIAFAPKEDLRGRVTDCSKDGFVLAMDVSCHSLIRATKLAEPLMKHGGSILTVSFYGSEKVVANYNMMGPVKAALESTVRYLAMELGPQMIRVNSLSPGPIKTRAASGLNQFDDLLLKAASQAPEHHIVSIGDVGTFASFLVSDYARSITGGVHYIDGGYHILG